MGPPASRQRTLASGENMLTGMLHHSEEYISFPEDPASFHFCSRKALRPEGPFGPEEALWGPKGALRAFLEQKWNEAGSSGNEMYFSESQVQKHTQAGRPAP